MSKSIHLMSKLLFKIVIYLGVAAAFLATVGGFIYVNFIEERFDFENKGIENIGVVTRANLGRSMDQVTHHVDGVRYKVGFIALPGLIIGERFYLLYNPDDPQDAVIQRWKPVFLDNESRTMTIGKLTYITDVKFGTPEPCMSFEYPVGAGDTLRKMQGLPINYKTLFPDLTAGQNYEVEYWQENPKRAIIYLDKPVERPSYPYDRKEKGPRGANPLDPLHL